MHESVAQSLAALASLELQRRYIVHATRDEYYVPEELLEEAYDVVRRIREQSSIRESISDQAATEILALEPLLDSAVEELEAMTLENYNPEQLVERAASWRFAREQARRCLELLGFDLAQFELTE
jgi:hypothetical protein